MLDLTGIKSISTAFNGKAALLSGYTIEVRLDSPKGDLIGSAKVNEGSRAPEIKLSPVEGAHKVFLVSKALPGEKGKVVWGVLRFGVR